MTFLCPICDCSEYDELDGLFFCKVCYTQSQEIHVQESEITYQGRPMLGLKKIKKYVNKRRGPSRDLGRPWTIYEAYQCIILGQCDALISLGVKKDVKDVVFLMWANYLSKLKVAFCKKEQVVPNTVLETACGRERELHRGTFEKPWNQTKMEMDLERDEYLYDSDSESHIFIDENLVDKKTYQKVVRSVEWMDLKKTAAFCYLGVQVTNPEILPYQFLRWIYEGKVPFMSTTHLLNQDMVLYGKDFHLFAPLLINVETLLTDTQKIRIYLMKRSPSPSIEFMIGRLVDMLHLPDELKHICKRFHDKVSLRCDDRKIGFAAAVYIALALKMIFVLDDNTEGQLSEYSQEVQRLVGSGANIFIWNEWRGYQMQKAKNEFDAYQDTRKGLNYKYKHLDQLVESYLNINKQHAQVSSKTQFVDNNTRAVEGLGKTLEMALVGLNKGKDASVECDIDTTSKPRFTESTLAHIVDIDVFKIRFRNTVAEGFSKVLKRQKKELRKMVYKQYPVDDANTLLESRASSYLWLLGLLASFVDCHIAKLDISVTKLQKKLEIRIKDR